MDIEKEDGLYGGEKGAAILKDKKIRTLIDYQKRIITNYNEKGEFVSEIKIIGNIEKKTLHRLVKV